MSASVRQEAVPLINPFSSLVGIGVLLSLSYLSINIMQDHSGITQLLVLMLIQATPFAFSLATGRPTFIAFVMFNHFVTYSVAKLNQMWNISKLAVVHESAQAAIGELITCSLLILASYYCMYPLALRSVDRTTFKQLHIPTRILHFIGIYGICHTEIYVHLPGMIRSLEIVFYFVTLVLLFSSQSTKPRLLTFYRFAALASAFYYFLRSGMLVYLGGIGGALFIILCLQRRRANFLLLGTLVLGLCILQPVKGWYRNYIKSDSANSITEKGHALYSLIAWKFFDIRLDDETAETMGLVLGEDGIELGVDEDDEATTTLAQGFARVGDDSLERILQWTPQKVPFWGGESYANIPYMFIPRFLWPGKPQWTFWNKFGRTYGFLSADDFNTSVAVGYIGEGYMNFGYMGMYVVAILVGIIIALVERLSFTYLSGAYLFSFACFLSTLVNFAQTLGAILNGVVLVTGIMLLFRPIIVRMTRPSP